MMRPGSSMSRAKHGKASYSGNAGIQIKQVENKVPTLPDYLKKRDWVGAIAFLENQRSFTDSKPENALYLAYSYFHNGDYRKAINIYDDLMKRPDYNKEYHVYKACCLFALVNYDEAKRECAKGPLTPLAIRLLFNIAHKKNDEKSLISFHHKLTSSTEDQLCLAGIHFLRNQFEDAIEIYKKLIIENKDYHALNVYMAMCYYKLDYFDVALDVLNNYLAQYPHSIIAVNLKACIQFQNYNGKLGEQEYKPLIQAYEGNNIYNDFDLLRHNLVVFRDGENAQQILPPLVDVFPEARLNLVIHYLKNDEATEAYNLVKDLEATMPREFILKAVSLAVLGQMTDSQEHIRKSQEFFQLVGASANECDTIPGRQCMASCLFLMKQFDDVLIYLKSIKAYFETDDDFNWNYGLACSSVNDFKEGEDALSKIVSEKYKSDDCYIKWITKCYIMNGKPEFLHSYLVLHGNSIFIWKLLQTNDCYRMGHFYYSLKAFDILARLDAESDYQDCLKGSVVGIFQQVIAGKDTADHLVEGIETLRITLPSHPQVEYIFRIVNKWGKENGIQV